MFRLLLAITITLTFSTPVFAQPAHSCGSILSVVYAHVDNMGYAPRAMPGSENVFNCIAARDPQFNDRRFQSAWEALNYWYILYGQELGVTLLPLPAPTN